MAYKNQTFGNLLRGMLSAIAAFEVKGVAAIEEEFGEQINMAPTALQRCKLGHVPIDPRHVAIFAEAGVRRAYLNRRWLERFLQSAQYYDSAALLDQLCPPTGVTAARPVRANDNLPAPTYSQFVMRRAAYADLREGLRQRSAAVVLVSMGGNGKTSLAREVAAQCLRAAHASPLSLVDDTPAFDTAVWVSDKDQPGSTRLSSVLDVIARTLDYPALTRLDLRDKAFEVEQLLRQQRVLLVVDNVETITDDTLLQWLLRLPEPSKVILITRVYQRVFQHGTWLVELDGLGEHEVQEFVRYQLRQRKLVAPDHDALYQRLATATGGNPKAIAMVVGYAKQTGHTIDAVLRTLATQTDLFADLFAQSWALLDREAHYTLLALRVFPDSACQAALAQTAGVDEHTWERVISQLIDLDLVEVEHATHRDTHAPRFRLHPLTRAFLGTRGANEVVFLAAARERWLAWCVAYARQFGYTVDAMDRLQELDAEEPTLSAALDWAAAHEHDHTVIALANGIEFYYYVRALWGKKLALHRQYIAAAKRRNDRDALLAALAWHIQLLSRQGSLAEAEHYLPDLDALAQAGLTSEQGFAYHHTLGLYHLANGDWAAARWAWETIMVHYSATLEPHMQIGAQHWLATTLVQQGDAHAARAHYQTALEQARIHGYARFIGRNQLALALLDITDGTLDSATARLDETRALTSQDDHEQHARLHWASARLHVRHGALEEAQAAYQHAIALLDRMGLVREQQEAIAERHVFDVYAIGDSASTIVHSTAGNLHAH